MKKNIIALLAIVILSGCTAGYKTVVKPGFEYKPGIKAAVIGFKGDRKAAGEAIGDAFVTEFIGMGFNMVERGAFRHLIREQNIQGSIDRLYAREIGRITGADILITGSYIARKKNIKTSAPAHTYVNRRGDVRHTPLKVRRQSVVVFTNISVRFIDAGTGEILLSSTSQKECYVESMQDCIMDMAESIRKELGIR